MTNDERMRELVSAYLDSELSPDERAYVEQRLEHDRELRDYYRELLDVREAVRDLPRLTAPSGLQEMVMERVQAIAARTKAGQPTPAAGPRRRAGQLWPWVLTVVAAAVLVAIFWRPLTPPKDPNLAEKGRTAPSTGQPGDDAIGTPGAGSLADANGSNGGSGTDVSPATPSGRSDRPPSDLADNVTAPRTPDARVNRTPGASPVTPSVDNVASADNAAIPFMAMVVDVVLTPKGIEGGLFEEVLQRMDIPWQNAIPVDRSMERALLAQRAFGALGEKDLPLARPDDTDLEYFQLVFVVARGRQFDSLIQELNDRRAVGDVAAVELDFAMGSTESALFVQMEKLARQAPEVPVSLVHAHPVVLAEDLRIKLQDALISGQAKRNGQDLDPIDAVPPPDPADPVLPPADADAIRAMEELQFDVLFVLRSEATARKTSRP